MKKYFNISITFLLFFIGTVGFSFEFKSKLTPSEIELVEASLPKDLFEALGGKANINQKPKEIRFSEPLFDSTSNEASIFFSFDEYDFSTLAPPREDIDQTAKELLTNSGILVNVIIVPKVRTGNELFAFSFIKGITIGMTAFDAAGCDYVCGGPILLARVGTEKYKMMMESISKQFLDTILQLLNN